MHHRPVGPPLSARLSAATTRGLLLARRSLSARLIVGVLLCAVVTTLVLAVPVVSGVDTGRPEVNLGASSSSSAGRESGSPVIMGLDGGAVSSSTPAGTVTEDPRREQPTTAAGTTAPEATASGTTASGTTAPRTSGGAPTTVRTSTVVPKPPAPSETKEATTVAPPVAPEPVAAPESAVPPEPEEEVLALVNAERATAGCAPLVEDAGLAGVARAHSEDMRDRDFFDHVNPDGLDPFQRAEQAGQVDARAENIAYGRATAAAVMDDWMNSSEHRGNILDCELRTLGVGIADGPGGPWWTQLFGA